MGMIQHGVGKGGWCASQIVLRSLAEKYMFRSTVLGHYFPYNSVHIFRSSYILYTVSDLAYFVYPPVSDETKLISTVLVPIQLPLLVTNHLCRADASVLCALGLPEPSSRANASAFSPR